MKLNQNSLFAVLLRSPWWVSGLVAIGIIAAALFALVYADGAAAADPYKENAKVARETYKMDLKGCDGMKGQEKTNCRRQARAKYDQAKGEIKKNRATK